MPELQLAIDDRISTIVAKQIDLDFISHHKISGGRLFSFFFFALYSILRLNQGKEKPPPIQGTRFSILSALPSPCGFDAHGSKMAPPPLGILCIV